MWTQQDGAFRQVVHPHSFGRLNPLIRRMTITMIARMINNMITLIVNIHPFPIKVKHRPKQNLSNMFLFDLFIYRGAFWGELLISGEWDYAHDLNRISNVTVMSIIWTIVVMNGIAARGWGIVRFTDRHSIVVLCTAFVNAALLECGNETPIWHLRHKGYPDPCEGAIRALPNDAAMADIAFWSQCSAAVQPCLEGCDSPIRTAQAS